VRQKGDQQGRLGESDADIIAQRADLAATRDPRPMRQNGAR
jgi:hypothetical protein